MGEYYLMNKLRKKMTSTPSREAAIVAIEHMALLPSKRLVKLTKLSLDSLNSTLDLIYTETQTPPGSTLRSRIQIIVDNAS